MEGIAQNGWRTARLGTLIAACVLLVSCATRTVSPAAAPRSGAAPGFFLLEGDFLVAARERIRAGDPGCVEALAQLEREAGSALKQKPLSVMDKTQTPPSGDQHDYLSQAPYFWPDAKSPSGLPYIRRDGERNPAIYAIPDHRNMSKVEDVAGTLALAYFYTGNEAYAAKSAELLRAWFLDPATRMNPNLEFAQGVPGVNTGRGIGLIETAGLPSVVDAVGLLAGSASWTEGDQRGMQEWCGQFLRWMQESRNGRAEAAAANNHGTYYDVQVVSLALFTGRLELATNVVENAKTRRIARQIEPDGRQPLELARTKSWGYSVMNLRGLMNLAALGDRVGVDLWYYETADRRGIRGAVMFLLPYAAGQAKWPYEQLGGWTPNDFIPNLERAALHYHDPACSTALLKLSPSGSPRREILLQRTE